jgi:molecular chaperone GrpE
MNEEGEILQEGEKQDSHIPSLEESLRECQDKYLRLLAESENSRKRMQKEKHELTKYAVENVIVEFLHPLDSFEKALKFAESSSEEVKRWALGFEMILSQFKQILTNHGVFEFESKGKHFDPHLHDALEVTLTHDYPTGTIIEEFSKGYKIGERIIRVARVKVAKTPDNQTQEIEKNKKS